MDTLKNTERRPGESNKNYVYRVLRNNIMYMNLKPGEYVNENDIAKQLSVSRTPVREAMVKLQDEQLLDINPQRASMVTLLDWNMICEGVEIRRLIECSVYQEAAGCLSEKTKFELYQNLNQQEYFLSFGTAESMFEFQKLDLEFHHLIYLGVEREWSWNVVSRATQHFQRYLYLNGGEIISALSLEHQKRMLQMHRDLLDALVNQKPLDYFKFNFEHIFYYPELDSQRMASGSHADAYFLTQLLEEFSCYFVPITERTRQRLLGLSPKGSAGNPGL